MCITDETWMSCEAQEGTLAQCWAYDKGSVNGSCYYHYKLIPTMLLFPKTFYGIPFWNWLICGIFIWLDLCQCLPDVIWANSPKPDLVIRQGSISFVLPPLKAEVCCNTVMDCVCVYTSSCGLTSGSKVIARGNRKKHFEQRRDCSKSVSLQTWSMWLSVSWFS